MADIEKDALEREEELAFAEFADAEDAKVLGQPAPKPAEEEPKPEEPAPNEPGPAPVANPMDAADEEQKRYVAQLQAEIARLEHDNRSQRGRVSGLQKKLNDVENQPPAPDAAQPESALNNGETDNEFAEDFPDIYKQLTARDQKIQQLESQLQQAIEPLQQTHQQLEEQQQQQWLNTQYEELFTVHPDAKEVTQQPEFAQWLDVQAPAVQQMMGSQLAADNIALLNLYKATSGTSSTPTRDLAAYADIPQKGAPRQGTSVSRDDEEGWFAHFAAQEEQRLKR